MNPRADRSLPATSGPAGLLAATLLLGSVAPASAQFTDVTPGSGLFSALPTWGANFVDIDQDGDPDLNAGFHFYTGRIFSNKGNGTFSFFQLLQIAVGVLDRHAYTWVDMNGDGILDVICSHGGGGGCGCASDGNELWQGTGGGIFSLIPGSGGMLDSLGRGRSFCAADVDLDGDVDLYHAKAALALSPNSLYRNDGNFTFVDVAADWGIDEPHGTVAGLFADYDDDGDPDLLVGGNEEIRLTTLWRNDGGTFSNATAEAFGSLPVISWADWGDYDNDGDLDLAVAEGQDGIRDIWAVNGNEYWFFSNFRHGEDGVDGYAFTAAGEDPVARFRFNGLTLNSSVFLGPNAVNPPALADTVILDDSYVGAPTFTPGVDSGVYCWRQSPGGRWQIRVSGAPNSFGNYSCVVSTINPVTAPADSALELILLTPTRPRVYRNDGGVFSEQTGALGITTSVNPRSVYWVDMDNDGDLDLHQTNEGTTYFIGEPDVIWRNDGTTFTRFFGPAWAPGSLEHFADGAVWADYDRDGDMDLYLADGAGPFFFSATAPSTLYRNDVAAGNSLEFQIPRSSAGNTPIGARATCWVQGRQVHRRVRADSWEGFQKPLALHFGLGAAATFDSLIVEWPDGERRFIPGGQDPTGVFWPEPAADAAGGIGPLVPQPAFSRQMLSVDVPSPGRLRVEVYDIAGRRLRILDDDSHAVPGPRTISWDGRDESGRAVPPGVYFLRGTGDVEFSRKAVRLR